MAQYSNVGKPAFYIPWFDWRYSTGYITPTQGTESDIFFLNPQKSHHIHFEEGTSLRYSFNLTRAVEENAAYDEESGGLYGADGFAYVFLLGHNFEDRGVSAEVIFRNNGTDSFQTETGIQNYTNSTTAPTCNGYSIYKATWDFATADGIDLKINSIADTSSDGHIYFGCASVCTKWEPPHSPDLKLTMSREFDGVKNIETDGGGTLSNAKYTQVPYFAGGWPAWEMGGGAEGSSIYGMSRHLGRRTWDLQFSYISDSDLMPKSEGWYYYGVDDINTVQGGQTINTSDTFLGQVLNRVQGSHLPFIFLPDGNNVNGDQWAICRFDQDKFQLKQVANNVYNLKLKIRECW